MLDLFCYFRREQSELVPLRDGSDDKKVESPIIKITLKNTKPWLPTLKYILSTYAFTLSYPLMKQFALIAIAMIALVWFTSAQTRNGLVLTDTQAAIDYLYANGLTKFSTTQTFMANNSLRRDEAAAFFARFARDVLGRVPDTSKTECNTFTDLSLAHSDLKSEIIASCQLGLMKGSNGKFMPKASFSNAHVLTVIIRLIHAPQEEPSDKHRATEYMYAAVTLWLTEWLQVGKYENLDNNISRGEVAKLIEAAAKYQKESDEMGESIEQTIAEINYGQTGGSPSCLVITNPSANSIVTLPLTIQWEIQDPNTWCQRRAIFENEAWHVYIQDTNGNIASDTVILQITSDPYGWYPINFSATIQNLTNTPYTNEVNLKFSDNQQMDGIPYQSFILPVEIQ